jgi:hypothetical protein
MSIAVLVAWIAAGILLLRGSQYVLGARIYFTSAVREPDVAPIRPEQISPGELDLLSSVDAQLRSAGFRHVGFGQCAAFLTYYAERPHAGRKPLTWCNGSAARMTDRPVMDWRSSKG